MLSINPIRIAERVIIAIVFQNHCDQSIFKMKNLKLISSLGVITYGLYCLHFIGILIATTITSKLHVNIHLWQFFLRYFNGIINYNIYQ